MARPEPDGHVQGRFPTTQWSRVVTAASCDASEAREALSSLCQAYWYPIYAYIRHRGHAPEQAQDLTQDFFAYLLEHDLIAILFPQVADLDHARPPLYQGKAHCVRRRSAASINHASSVIHATYGRITSIAR